MVPNDLLNPSNIPPHLELPHPPEAVTNWSEYCYFFAYDPKQDIGVSIHIGRLFHDTSIWRGILYVFLPDGDILAHKCAGRDGHARGPGAGGFRATCVEPLRLWTLEFDGVLQRTSHEKMTGDVLRDGVDEPVKFHILLEAAAPLYSLQTHSPEGASWSHHHHEQIHRIRGEIFYKGERIELEGVGARDHSSGPRDYSPVLGAFWAQILFPSGRAVHALAVTRKGADLTTGYVTSNAQRGYIYWNDGMPLEMVDVLSVPEICGEDTPLRSVPRDVMRNEAQRKFTMVLGSSRGPQSFEVERIRAVTSTYIPPSDEIGGTDLTRLDSLQQSKTIMRVIWNGEVGYAMSDNLAAIKYLQIG